MAFDKALQQEEVESESETEETEKDDERDTDSEGEEEVSLSAIICEIRSKLAIYLLVFRTLPYWIRYGCVFK